MKGRVVHMVTLILILVLFAYFGHATVMGYDSKVMKLVYYDQAAPLSFVENGEVKGILIDIMNEAIRNRMKIALVQEAYPWARAQNMVKNGEADGFVTVPTDERKAYTNVSTETVVELVQSIFIKKDNPNVEKLKLVKTLDDLKALNLKVGTYLGSGWNKEKLAGFDVIEAPTPENIISMMMGGRVDIFISPSLAVNYLIKRLNLKGQITEFPTTWGTAYFNLCINKGSSFVSILTKFDEIIKDMKSKKEIDAILNTYK